MTQACADCRADNRDGARFCRGCGRRLAPLSSAPLNGVPGTGEEWAATQRMPMDSDLRMPPPTRRKRSMAPLPAAASRKVAPASRVSAPRGVAAPPPRPNPMRTAVIGLLIAGAVAAAAGWFFSTGSHGSGSTAQTPPAPAAPVLPAAPEPSAQPPAALESAAPRPLPAEPPAPEPEPAATPPAAASLPAEPTPAPEPAPPAATPPPPVASPKPPPPKPRKPAPPPAAPAPVVVAAPPPEPAAPPPAPAPTPQALCAGLNFIARAQCLAAQCAKPELRSHAQCDAVRRQQQIEEERRNPTLLN